ncbi:F0F1 ATP synthase subunit delta [Aeromonas schubertii]|uniref:ATP synthase subunit delta n=1 Tax=Aeromonas schubertii TaxID=652 RepID=A0ABS7VC12_9GAMM|nr:F0F1 ATP synthase subunit delta [Aeromonas schubertii]KUE78212.1 ATP F0F1 synthase subunit delta [Aeromonas schubertii]MBZ6066917.1 F0F1 ATP synthase subunit delta [Aeromonas schubertii]MBZ6073683.1 F0F1 ATP synthase subunit delta [Aeromonas schubertii]QCG46466.1 F0F1 ATP synthase subunit delta [Aeromonas schubertii]
MSELTTIARPYAKAAFDFAVEQQAIAQWQEMLEFAAQVAENDTVAALISGAMAADQLANVFVGVCGEQLNEHGQNLIRVMAENGRLSVLPAVAVEFHLLKAEHEKSVEAEVVSAVELTEQQKADIQASLEKRLARKVKLNCSTDASLMAGVLIRAGDLVIDGSLRGKLDRMADALQS